MMRLSKSFGAAWLLSIPSFASSAVAAEPAPSASATRAPVAPAPIAPAPAASGGAAFSLVDARASANVDAGTGGDGF